MQKEEIDQPEASPNLNHPEAAETIKSNAERRARHVFITMGRLQGYIFIHIKFVGVSRPRRCDLKAF